MFYKAVTSSLVIDKKHVANQVMIVVTAEGEECDLVGGSDRSTHALSG